jgi:hypothetical protein
MARLLVLTAVLLAGLFAFPRAGVADTPTNDVPFDLEAGVPLAYIGGLQVFNVYWDSDWNDPGHNDGFSTGDIDAATQALADSNYLDKLEQYGVPDISWGGSATAVSFPCGSNPGTTTSSLAIVGFILCEEITPFDGVPLATGIPLPIPLVPNPTGHTIYNVILPRSTTIDDFGSRSCVDYGAYHFQVPSALGFPIYYTVIPSKCASSVSDLMRLMSHEIVEAATDPMPLFHWIDNSTRTPGLIDFFASIPGLLKAGEAADLCSSANPATSSPFGNIPVTLNGISMQVGAYWSNADNACMVGPSRAVRARFTTNGLSGTSTTLHIGTENVTISPGSTITRIVPEGTSFSFDDATVDAGERFVANGADCSGTVPFETGNTTADATVTLTCAYRHEYRLTVNTSPAAAAVGNATLTASNWFQSGTTVPLSADANVPAATGSRYHFDHWESGPLTLPDASITMSSPKTATAVYRLQRLISFDETGIPAATTWHVTVGGAPHTGPYSEWVDDQSSLSFSYQSPVRDAVDATTRYVLSGTSASSPLLVTGPLTVVGTYATEYLLSVGTSGLGTNTTSVSNGATSIGTATDAAPATAWLPAGTPLDLHVDDPVNGAGGVEYFFQSFTPAPPATLASGVSTTAGYQTMAQQIDDALASGGIFGQNGPGLAGSLKQQFDAVQADLAAGNFAQALDDLESFVSHVAAQSGKKITPATATALELDAANVYHYALCRAAALGQITPATHAMRYAYYSALVTSLGGTRLADC